MYHVAQVNVTLRYGKVGHDFKIGIKLYQLYKIINGLTPQYLRNILPPRVHELTRYQLRNTDDFAILVSRTASYYNPFLQPTIRDRNALSPTIRNSATLNTFKNRIYNTQGERVSLPKYTRATTWQNQKNDCAPSEDSDQPGHQPSLIRVFAVRMKKPWVLSYPLSAQRRLWSDWLICLRWAHSHFVCFVMSRFISTVQTTRDGQIYHTRLRLQCSALNQYLHSKNIIESPLCTCGAVEDSAHYLLVCPNYRTNRQRNIFTLPHAPTLPLLLNGNPVLPDEVNDQIFSQVQLFILSSKRFKNVER